MDPIRVKSTTSARPFSWKIGPTIRPRSRANMCGDVWKGRKKKEKGLRLIKGKKGLSLPKDDCLLLIYKRGFFPLNQFCSGSIRFRYSRRKQMISIKRNHTQPDSSGLVYTFVVSPATPQLGRFFFSLTCASFFCEG